MRFNRFVSAIPRLAVVAVVALMVGLVAAPALAQITRGAISGTVRDQSGGVVPGATVVITNVGTNDTRTLVTDSQGFYRAAGLEPGTYKVLTALAGFGTVERREIELRSAGEVSLEFELKPAGVGEAITVTAESPLIDMSKTSTADVRESAETLIIFDVDVCGPEYFVSIVSLLMVYGVSLLFAQAVCLMYLKERAVYVREF